MATHFGFFTVIPRTDTPISLTPGGDIDHDLNFHLPPDTTRDLGFLTFMADARSPNNLT